MSDWDHNNEKLPNWFHDNEKMPMVKVRGGSTYSYVDGAFKFTFYPYSGLIRPNNQVSLFRAIEFFAKLGFDIDWVKTNTIALHLYITLPEHYEEDEIVELVNKTRKQLTDEERERKLKLRNEITKNNIFNEDGRHLRRQYLIDKFSNFRVDNGKSRQDLVDWINHFNIERPSKPLVTVGTKSKAIILEEAERSLLSLWDKGELRYLTEDEYLAKLDKYKKK